MVTLPLGMLAVTASLLELSFWTVQKPYLTSAGFSVVVEVSKVIEPVGFEPLSRIFNWPAVKVLPVELAVLVKNARVPRPLWELSAPSTSSKPRITRRLARRTTCVFNSFIYLLLLLRKAALRFSLSPG